MSTEPGAGHSGANAIGISQFLEKEFGRRNVFIDVDMHAGAKFSDVLEQRLGECKVVIALIGPEWLDARNERNERRLDQADDWVRLEIARALARGITVIPTLVNGARLPSRNELPADIQALVDHQAVSVSHTGFRHEMASLGRDINSIRRATPFKKYLIATALVAFLAICLAAFALRSPLNKLDQPAESERTLWNASPGEWVMFAIDKHPTSYFYQHSSLRLDADRVFYTARYLVASDPSGSPRSRQEFYRARSWTIEQ